ncbi:uncharacterized protein [Antedon mediterranea]|uniref:uncharacterized protein n=1 Tax=Antedon mediterranea TaxID=105859 RepID=UPI003AF54559
MSSTNNAKVIVKPVHEVQVRLDISENVETHSSTKEDEVFSSMPVVDIPFSCVKIVPQTEESCSLPTSEQLTQSSQPTSKQQLISNQDDVLSVVIQKLTELVESSDSSKEANLSGSSTPKSNVEATNETNLEQTKSKGKCKLFKCPNCPCLFSVTKAQLRRKVHPLCPCCVKSKSTQHLHVEKTVNQTLIKCELCNALFSSYSDVLLHLGTHTNVTIFKCCLCDFVTTQQQNILKHESVHYTRQNEHKSFKCAQCNLSVSDFAELQTHLKMHNQNQELLFKCSDCGFASKCEDSLRKHMWMHMQQPNSKYKQNPHCALMETPVASSKEDVNHDMLCRIKGSVCPMQDGLNTQVFLYKCPLCSYICEKLSTLKCHVWRHAGDRKCAYPLIDDIESLKEAVIPVTTNVNDINVQKTGQTKIAVGCCIDNNKTCCEKRNDSSCQCEAISVSKEHYPIIENLIDNPDSIHQASTEDISEPNNNKTVSEIVKQKDVQLLSETLPPISFVESSTGVQNTSINSIQDIFFHIDGSIIIPNPEEIVVSQAVEIQGNSTHQIEIPTDLVPSVVPLDEENKSSAAADSVRCNDVAVFKERKEEETVAKIPILETLLKNSEEISKIILNENENADSSLINSNKRNTNEEIEQFNVREEIVQSSPIHSLSDDSEKTGICDSLLCVIETLVESSTDEESPKTKRKRKQGENVENNVRKTARKDFQCELCSYKTTSSGYMQRHMKYHTASKPNQCPFCQFQAVDSEQLNTHMVTDCQKTIYTCETCSAKFHFKSKFINHMQTHDKHLFKCKYCSFETTSKNEVEKHSSVHQKCDGVDIAQPLNDTDTEECISFSCNMCNTIVQSQDDLETHMKIHMKTYKCQLCDYSSATANGVKNHMKFHSKDRPHKCPLCKFSGAYPQSLRAHMKTHMQEYNFSLPATSEVFKCKLCGYTCSHLPSLKSHMWKHASDPHFNYERSMSHIKQGNDPQSKGLNTEAKSKSDKPTNLTANEENLVLVRYQCAHCGYVGTTKDLLITHIRAEHNIQEDNQ